MSSGFSDFGNAYNFMTYIFLQLGQDEQHAAAVIGCAKHSADSMSRSAGPHCSQLERSDD